ncbi:MAG: hypothetical protein KDJ45_11710, partial [Hyphomicrobiaceae bacterium]|nr:hypothetical protein [Hyphomicrobiaceae bacterium]
MDVQQILGKTNLQSPMHIARPRTKDAEPYWTAWTQSILFSISQTIIFHCHTQVFWIERLI